MKQKTMKDVIRDKELGSSPLRMLLYFKSVMKPGEVHTFSLNDLTQELDIPFATAASGALKKLQDKGYIDKWREGNDLKCVLLVK